MPTFISLMELVIQVKRWLRKGREGAVRFFPLGTKVDNRARDKERELKCFKKIKKTMNYVDQLKVRNGIKKENKRYE